MIDFELSEGNHTKNEDSSKKAPSLATLPPCGKKVNATLEQRIEVLDWFHKNKKSQGATAKYFDTLPGFRDLQLKQPIISQWLKDESMWRARWAEAQTMGHRKAKCVCQTEHPEVTEMLDLWIAQAMNDGIIITGDTLKMKYREFEKLAGVPNDERLTLSGGWLDSTKKQNGLSSVKRHGEAASAKEEDVVAERARMMKKISDATGYQLKDIFNMDEAGLFYA